MHLHTIFFLYWSHVIHYLDIKKYYPPVALLTSIVIFFVISSKDAFKMFFDSTNQIQIIIENFNIFLVICVLILVISFYIIGSLIYSSINSAIILYKYIRFEENISKKLLLDKIHEFHMGQQFNFMEFKVSDKVLLLYLYDLKIIN